MVQQEDIRDEVFAGGLRQGDPMAFKAIFDLYWIPLFKYAESKIKSKEDAEELVQNIFMELWEKKEKLVITNLYNFLKVCLRNKCIDYLRVKILEGKYSDYCKQLSETSCNNTQEAIYLVDLSTRVNEGLINLPSKTQLVFKLNRFDRLSIKQTAQKLNLSEKAVEYHLTKALKLMRVYLKDFVLIFCLLMPMY